MDVSSLAPMIQQILSAPDTNLITVTAKGVRHQLLGLDPNITIEFIKQNKKEIDELIKSIFETVNQSEDNLVAPEESNQDNVFVYGNGKRKREGHDRGIKNEDDVDVKREEDGSQDEPESRDDEDGQSQPTTPVRKKAKRTNRQALADEEYARQLSSELNQRPSRGSRNANGVSKKGASRTPKKTKSRAEIEDSDEDDDVEGSSGKRKPSKARKKGSGGGDAKGGFAKEFTLSEPLAAVVNTPRLSRPQVVKKLWEYIKGNELQNPGNRREILCDDAMRAVFNTDKIDMFTMNKILGQHLYELES
ncbi:SWIB-domain-containing protein [Ramaria rubella]|nr:SWIB-domain-containing protein [Ramaria rubella]